MTNPTKVETSKRLVRTDVTKYPSKSHIGWGIWGTGKVAWEFGQSLRKLPQTRVIGVASRTFSKAENLAKNIKTRSFSNYQDLLESPEVDVVYIATPPHCHFQDALLALENGKGVLCEKPFALNLEEATTLINKARNSGLFCMEAMWMRFIPLIQELKDLIGTGCIGKPLLMTGDFGYPLVPSTSHHLFAKNAGGGALMDRSVYLVSLSQSLFGTPKRIESIATLGKRGEDETTALILEYENGPLVQASASLRTMGTNDVVIRGDRGTLKIHAPFFKPHRITIDQFSPRELTTESANSSQLSHASSFLRAMMQSKTLRKLYYPLQEVLRPLGSRHGQILYKPFGGSGYQFEAEAVNQCLLKGEIECPLMPHSATLEVLGILYAAKRSWARAYE